MSIADRASAGAGRLLERVASRAAGPHQSAVVRIGIAFTWLLFLLRELPHREDLWGPDSSWGLDLAGPALAESGGFSVFMWSESDLWFEFCYFLGIAASAALLLGWRTRTASVIFMVMVVSLQSRSQHLGGAGENLIRLVSLYLVLTRCGQVWSLDARRAARRTDAPSDRQGIGLWLVTGGALALSTAGGDLDSRGWLIVLWGLWAVHALWWAVSRRLPGEPRTVLQCAGHLVHNAALLMVMFEVCLIYASAGWYKIQGTRWQDGTAVYYTMHLDNYGSWPEVGDLLSSSWTLVLLMTYGTVLMQVAFPFTVLNRRVKNVLLVCLIAEHVAIGVLMALPFFSMAMIAVDIVFLPTPFLIAVGDRVGRLRDRVVRRRGAPSPAGEGPARRPQLVGGAPPAG
ncbi:HTTM domain-containing protein [Streptomyces sp. DSM 44917]|uniref:HTTM domain-containing protein n=1 Tax=Streptomyces boetiae TaxID=3075541 RepID=A0ABU2L911_9ACTN|nr:HTTM domain-containing protein [Streptomyces sp. DSM 44917]MDT0307961.1 HTTM domain-containing protein [Streptomyces sp. DSM 44917]